MNPLFRQSADLTWLWARTGEPVQPSDRRYFGLEKDEAQKLTGPMLAPGYYRPIVNQPEIPHSDWYITR